MSICNALFDLAQLALASGDQDVAFRRFAEGIPLSEEMGDRANVAYIIRGMAAVAGRRGEPECSARLFGAAEGLIDEIGLRLHIFEPNTSLYEDTMAEVRSRLGEPAFEEARAEERAMGFEEVVAYALEGGSAADPLPSPKPRGA